MATSVALSPSPVLQFFDNTGKPAIGGSLTTQVGGINYPTYSDSLGAVALPNPIPLNSRGEVSTAAGTSTTLFLQTGVSYTFILKDSAGNQLWSVSNISSQNGQAVSFPTSSGSANAQVVTNAVPISLGPGVIQWFLPVAANTGPTTLNVDNTGAKNVFLFTKALAFGELQIGVPAQVIYDGTQWNLVNSAKGPAADYYVDTGTASNYIVAINMVQALTQSGMNFRVKVANTNASGATMTINGSGPFSIYRQGGSLATTGSMISGQIYEFTFDATIGGPILQNPSTVNGTFTATLATGLTTTPSGTLNYSISPDGITVTVWATAQIAGTSNATGMTITGWPAIIQSSNSTVANTCWWRDSSSNIPGLATGMNSGTVTCLAGASLSASGFTNTGSKGIQAGFRLSYQL